MIDYGVCALNWTKTFPQVGVNTYVLNKMPNDCTDPAYMAGTHEQSRCELAGSHTQLI